MTTPIIKKVSIIMLLVVASMAGFSQGPPSFYHQERIACDFFSAKYETIIFNPSIEFTANSKEELINNVQKAILTNILGKTYINECFLKAIHEVSGQYINVNQDDIFFKRDKYCFILEKAQVQKIAITYIINSLYYYLGMPTVVIYNPDNFIGNQNTGEIIRNKLVSSLLSNTCQINNILKLDDMPVCERRNDESNFMTLLRCIKECRMINPKFVWIIKSTDIKQNKTEEVNLFAEVEIHIQLINFETHEILVDKFIKGYAQAENYGEALNLAINTAIKDNVDNLVRDYYKKMVYQILDGKNFTISINRQSINNINCLRDELESKCINVTDYKTHDDVTILECSSYILEVPELLTIVYKACENCKMPNNIRIESGNFIVE